MAPLKLRNYYLTEDYDQAAIAYRKCIEVADNNKLLLGASDWLYNTYWKNSEPDKAAEVIAAISPDIEIDKNHYYLKRVLFYKGILKLNDLIDMDKPVDQWTGSDITVGHGIASWLNYHGEFEQADKIFRSILQVRYWNAWSYIATEKEYSDK